MRQDHDYVTMADYVSDTREIVENAKAVIEELKRTIREREIMMWAMVRASGGTLLVSQSDVAAGYPASWRIDEDPASGGTRFTITK